MKQSIDKQLQYGAIHVHSEYSNVRLRDSINRIEDMLINAHEKGLYGLCLTDHEILAGHFELLQVATKLKEQSTIPQDFKIGLGNEIYLVDDIEDVRQQGRFPHFLLIAKDKIGHIALRHASNTAWNNMFSRGNMDRVPIQKNELKQIIAQQGKGHIVGSTACLGSEYAQLVLDLIMYEKIYQHIEAGVTLQQLQGDIYTEILLSRFLPNVDKFKENKWEFLDLYQSSNRSEDDEIILKDMIDTMLQHYITTIHSNQDMLLQKTKQTIQQTKVKIHRFINWCIDVFGKDDFYIEIQPSDSVEQILYNSTAVKIGQAYNLKTIVTTDAHFLNKEDIAFQHAFLNAQQGDRETASFYASCYIQTPQEVLDNLTTVSQLPIEVVQEAMQNTINILDQCEEYSLHEPVALPNVANIDETTIDVSKFISLLNDYKYIAKYYHSDNIQDRWLLHLIQHGMDNKQLKWTNKRIKRIDDELKEIWLVSEGTKEKMSQYYNSAREFINIMWNEGDSIVGVARGSVTGLFIAYLVDITQINPMEYDLPYWRHIHHSKISLADIDIDTEALKRGKILQAMKDRFGEKNVVNICTFGREGTKSTIQTACRGLGIDIATSAFLSSLVPVERGKAWSLDDMFYGNEEKDRKPHKEFIREVEQYPDLKNTMYRFEGLINKRSVHASGVLFYDEHTTERAMVMRSPSGQLITQYDMDVAEEVMGMVKMDFLTVEALDIIRITMDYLVQYGFMEWQGSLRQTYNKYLHPDVLDYNTPEMWDMIASGEIIKLFQFTTDLGQSMAMKSTPRTLQELASANSLMRLATDNDEQPIDRFVRFKDNIQEWYDECREFGLTQDEIEILEPHLLPVHGQANTQEDLMEMLMNPKISSFTIPEADRARKGLAKKKVKDIKATKTLYFKKGREVVGASEELLNYVWKYQIEPQLG